MSDRTTTGASLTFPLAFCDRLRMATDGTGVTALVGAYGCPLRCKLCINPQTWRPRKDGKPGFRWVTLEELYDKVKQDNLYYLATGGGITFGGGEPLVHARFIEAFRAICPPEWHFTAESCLSIDPDLIPIAARAVDAFFIDIKDTSPAVYKAYTGVDHTLAMQNLAALLALVGPDRITVRVPRIPGYNTEADVDASVRRLHDMGLSRLDLFTYKQPKSR